MRVVSRAIWRGLAWAIVAMMLVTTVVVAQSASPSTDPLGDFTHVPGTEAVPGGLAWVPVELVGTQDPARIYGLTGWTNGFAMLEHPRGPGRTGYAVWTSPDGLDWTRAELPAAVKDPYWLEPHRDGLVLAAERRRGYHDDSARMDFWRSSDGVEWHLSGSVEAAVPRRLDDLRIVPQALFPMDRRLSLLMVLVPAGSGAGGRSGDVTEFVVATQRGFDRDRVPSDRAWAWTSRTGRNWSRGSVDGLRDRLGRVSVMETMTTSTHAWLARDGAQRALLRSANGLRWRKLAALPNHVEEGGNQALVWADGAPLLFGDNGDPAGSEGCGNRLGGWRLDQVTEPWIEILDRQPAFAHGVAAEGSWVVLSGSSWCAGEWAWTLVSPDGGRTWDPELSWTGAIGTCLGEAAMQDRRVVVLGCKGRHRGDADMPLWVASLPDAGGGS